MLRTLPCDDVHMDTTTEPIHIARARWLRLMIPQLWALGFARLAAEYQVELDRLEDIT